MMVLGDGAFGRYLGHKGRAFMSEINFPIKETPTDLIGPFTMQNKTQS